MEQIVKIVQTLYQKVTIPNMSSDSLQKCKTQEHKNK